MDAVFLQDTAKGKVVYDKKKGPRTEPWGTPVLTGEDCDVNDKLDAF